MQLDEIVGRWHAGRGEGAGGAAREGSSGAEPGVPSWALGCFRRRCITFFDGTEDTTTEVLWLQSRGLTADFRRSPGIPRPDSLAALARLSPAERIALGRVEGGLALTRWDGRHMSWTGWESFQNHAKWPEPGRLARVGSCLVELAPSGAYVEDWRLEPCGTGPLIGLRLLDERDRDTGAVLHRGGGLIVCGQRAAFIRGRPTPLPEGRRLEQLLSDASATPEQLAAVFACDVAFGEARGEHAGAADSGAAHSGREHPFTVTHATLPWREGQALLSLEGFELDPELDHVVQRVEEAGRQLERRFVIDTLEPTFPDNPSTHVTPEGRAWFELEREGLIGATSRR